LLDVFGLLIPFFLWRISIRNTTATILDSFFALLEMHTGLLFLIDLEMKCVVILPESCREWVVQGHISGQLAR
jgi:hypothetical protein